MIGENQNGRIRNGLRAWRLATVSVVALLAAQAASAQEPTPPTEDVTVITITGSKIKRKDADTVGPLETLTREDLANSGASSVGDVLQKLPSAGVSLNSNGTQGTSYGASSINLRYLGGAEGSGNRVLVLVDGHRWVDGVGQRGFRDFVDLNTIPFGMIDSIELLKDGASAIYGADAIAGVVNIHTLRNFEGLKVQTKYGLSSRSDGEEHSAIVNWGKRFGDDSLVVSLSWQKTGAILTTDRDISKVSLVPVTTPPTSANGLYILPGLAANSYFGTAAGFASVATPAAYNGGAGYGAAALADNSYHTASLPGDYYNTLAQGVDAAGPSERAGIFARYTHPIGDNLTLKVEALYNERESYQVFAPFLMSIGGTRGTVRGFSIAKNQAFNPFGTANGVPTANALGFAANQAWEIRLATVGLGNRVNYQDVKTSRINAGLDGDITLFKRDWHWSAHAAWSKNHIYDTANGQVDYDRLALALGDPAACTAVAGCVPVSLFSPMTAQMKSYIESVAVESNWTQVKDLTFDVSGDLLSLPAGPLAIAFGAEHRENKGVDHPDPYVNAATVYLPAGTVTTSNPTRTVTAGEYSLNEYYLEASIPIFKDVFLAKSLDVDIATRYSDYDSVGGHQTSKVGIGYRPVEGLLLRGTYSQGFRAPSILELYQGARATNFQGTDPCNGGAAAHPTLPGCAGIPSTYNQVNYIGGLLAGTISGNTALVPETADTYSYGFTVKPAFLRGFSLTSDWYRVVIRDAISSQTATQILNLCATQGGVSCGQVIRDPASGQVFNLVQGALNLNEIVTTGVDTTARYDFRTSFGRLSAAVSTSYLAEYKTVSPNPAGGADVVDNRVGKGDTPRGTYPEWKGQASLSWSDGPARILWRGRYIGETTDVANAVKDSLTKAIFYQDVEGGYRFDTHALNLTIGISNIFDKMPPVSYANAPINFDIYTYDVRGRYGYVRLAAEF